MQRSEKIIETYIDGAGVEKVSSVTWLHLDLDRLTYNVSAVTMKTRHRKQV
jgi:hypothetical protein